MAGPISIQSGKSTLNLFVDASKARMDGAGRFVAEGLTFTHDQPETWHNRIFVRIVETSGAAGLNGPVVFWLESAEAASSPRFEVAQIHPGLWASAEELEFPGVPALGFRACAAVPIAEEVRVFTIIHQSEAPIAFDASDKETGV